MNLKNFFAEAVVSENQFIAEFPGGISLFLKREDRLHAEVSGNKFRKLKYNLLEAQKLAKNSLLTFGGAYSNHITATAAAGRLAGFKTNGVIRGEELGRDLQKTLQQNPSLKFADSCGMQLHFVSREEYREKNSEEFLGKLKSKFGDFYLLPEGGTNALAVKGSEEILSPVDNDFDFVACAVGTGGTIGGIINASAENQICLGFPALKGDFLSAEIEKFSNKKNWKLITDYHFGGYAKFNEELIAFINEFRENFKIQLDPIYTGKLVFGIFDLIKKDYFPPSSKILAIHTGGLQGISGMNTVLKKKNLPLIRN